MAEQKFLIGAATAGHQVEGNNTNSDTWALEQMKYGGYPEKSGLADDHYHRYEEDILLARKAGLNAYRFSLEWARIEPQEGVFDAEETEHYRNVMQFCYDNGVEPVVTLLHFTCPKWLISKGGWEADTTIEYFARYVRYVCEQYGNLLHYVVTINEANMGVLIAGYIKLAMEQQAKEAGNSLQIGMDLEAVALQNKEKTEENLAVFGVEEPAVFTSPRTDHGNEIIRKAHQKAVGIIHELVPQAKAGMSLSLNDMQCIAGGELRAEEAWQQNFLQFVSALENDDFLGVQNYTRTVYGPEGELRPAADAEVTQMGYEYYPQGLAHVLEKVHESFPKELLVTESGIATDEDERRCSYIQEALNGVKNCCQKGIPVNGYFYWSLLDNYEWQSGYSMRFGLIAVDRSTLQRMPKQSLQVLGSFLGTM